MAAGGVINTFSALLMCYVTVRELGASLQAPPRAKYHAARLDQGGCRTINLAIVSLPTSNSVWSSVAIADRWGAAEQVANRSLDFDRNAHTLRYDVMCAVGNGFSPHFMHTWAPT